MFDIGFLELILVSIVGLLVLGPERLPGAIRTVSLFVGKMRRSFNGIRSEIERELRADEIRQELHNQSIMADLRKAQKDIQDTTDAVRKGLGHDPEVKLGKDGYPVDQPFGEPSETEEAPAAEEAPATEAAHDAEEETTVAEDSETSSAEEPAAEADEDSSRAAESNRT